MPMTGNFLFISSICFLWVCMHAELLVQQQCHYLRLQLQLSRFKLKASVAVRSGNCIYSATCSSRCTVVSWKCCPGVCPPPRFFTLLGNVPLTIFLLCLHSERGMGMSIFLANPISSGKYSGTSCRDVLHATLTGSTIDTTAAVGSTCTVSADSLSLRLQCAALVLASPCRVMVEVIPLVHTVLFGVLCR